MADNLTLATSRAVATAFKDADTFCLELFPANHASRPRIKEQAALRAAVLTAFQTQTATLGALAFDVRDDMTEAELRAWAADFKRLVAS